MEDSPDTLRAALLLTNRLVQLDAKPLAAREFWTLHEQIDLGQLLHHDAASIATSFDLPDDRAERMRTLLDASTALGFEQERLSDGGIELVSALDERFPDRLRDRLGTTCPPFLLVAGPIEKLGQGGLGVVGSRDAAPAAETAATDAARAAVTHDMTVVSGLARGIDQAAMAGALQSGGRVVGVPADGIVRAARSASVRTHVHAGDLCVASPYAPNAPFRAGNAMGRNKIIYAFSTITFVVSSDEGAGGTWSGAKEALSRNFGPVAVWVGDGAKEGNDALVRLGATPISDIEQLFDLDPDQMSKPLQESLF